MDTAALEPVITLIREYSWTPYRKVLTCAPDIEDALRAACAEAPRKSYFPDPFGIFTGIDVVVAGDSAPGTWRLVRHDHCEVKITDPVSESWVSHQGCTILATSE